MPNPIVVPHLDKAQLQLAGATRIINVAATAVAARGIAHLSLTGCRKPAERYRGLV